MTNQIKLLGVIAILGASLVASGFVLVDVMAASANKTVYEATNPVVIAESEGLIQGLSAEEVLASVDFKASKPQDVLVLYNEECSIYQELHLKSKKQQTGEAGEELAEAKSSHTVQLYVDGTPVGSEITMCDRTYGIETNILNQIQDLCISVNTLDGTTTCDESFLRTWLNTKAAHGWNWVVLNLGQDYDTEQMHNIMVKGTVDDETDGPATSAVMIGERSLIVLPTQLGTDAT